MDIQLDTEPARSPCPPISPNTAGARSTGRGHVRRAGVPPEGVGALDRGGEKPEPGDAPRRGCRRHAARGASAALRSLRQPTRRHADFMRWRAARSTGGFRVLELDPATRFLMTAGRSGRRGPHRRRLHIGRARSRSPPSPNRAACMADVLPRRCPDRPTSSPASATVAVDQQPAIDDARRRKAAVPRAPPGFLRGGSRCMTTFPHRPRAPVRRITEVGSAS